MTEPFFYTAERFFPDENYEQFSKIFGRAEIVTYDTNLCGVNSTHGLYGKSRYAGEVDNWKELLYVPIKENEQIIAYYKNPIKSHEHHMLNDNFEFCGYDLSEELTMISAITNCGDMFDKVIPRKKLNTFGLIDKYSEAFLIRKLLGEIYPKESHARCEVCQQPSSKDSGLLNF